MLRVLLLTALSVNVFAEAQPPEWWPRHVGGHAATLLDGEWAFGFSDDLEDAMAVTEAGLLLMLNGIARVPSCVDAAPPGIPGKRGTAVYSRPFETPEGGGRDYRLAFMGCAFYCRVWVDGLEVGSSRNGGYAPFSLDVPSKAGERRLTVLADNRFNATTAPLHTGGDFWHFGGLVRSVVLHSAPLGVPTVARCYVTPRRVGASWVLGLEVVLTREQAGKKLKVSIQFDGELAVSESLDFDVDGKARLDDFRGVPSDATVWELGSRGALHTLTVTTQGGGVQERFGLREWAASSSTGKRRSITLNGKIVKLHGWNHHTQWPETAMSPNATQMDADLALLVEGGANFVRGAHYPQDQRWLDRLDAAGIAMWEEALGPGVKVYNLRDPEFMALQLSQIDAMVGASLNHASIFAWGFLNEGPSDDPLACPGYAACSNRLAELDPSRLTTYASKMGLEDACLSVVELASFNSYPAWYFEPGDLSAIKKFWGGISGWLQSAFPEKPFIISETGAGGIYEYYDDNASDVFWGLAYQTEVLARNVDFALEDDHVSGIALWHFFDFKGNDGAQRSGPCDYLPDVYPPTCGFINVSVAKGRPGGENHKGALDYYRRPKPGFAVVAEKYKNYSSSSASSSDGQEDYI